MGYGPNPARRGAIVEKIGHSAAVLWAGWWPRIPAARGTARARGGVGRGRGGAEDRSLLARGDYDRSAARRR